MGGMIYIHIHKTNADDILAACDEDILGQTFRSGKAKITVTETFYNGELVPEEAFVAKLKEYRNINLVGNRVVDLAIENKIVDPDYVMTIGDVKYAQVVKC